MGEAVRLFDAKAREGVAGIGFCEICDVHCHSVAVERVLETGAGYAGG